MRHTLRLATDVTSSTDRSPALIHDLSQLGLSMETSAQLVEGESIFIELPFVGTKETRVVWRKDRIFGCEFRLPLPEASTIAVLLGSENFSSQGKTEGRMEEVVVGVQPTLDDLKRWEDDFLRSKLAAGYQLIGFRQTSDGLTIAMLTRVE